MILQDSHLLHHQLHQPLQDSPYHLWLPTYHIITVTICSHGNLQVLREHQQVRGDPPVQRNLQVLVVQDVQDCQQYQELQQCHHHQVVQLVQGSLV